MSEHKAIDSFNKFFDGLDSFVNSKTVVGDPIKVDDAVIIPLVDISCGMAAGDFSADKDAGGMYTKMSPTALLILQNGTSKLVSLKNTDAVSKLIDLVPDVVNKITGTTKISSKAELKAKEMAEDMKPVIEEG